MYMKRIGGWLHHLRADARLFICIGVAALALIAVLFTGLEFLTSMLLSWDTFCLVLIVLSWIMFLSMPGSDVYREAQRQDESRTGIFILVLGAVCVSMIGILLLMKPSMDMRTHREAHRAISLLGVALSWVLLHTLFTLRYAHLYYTDPKAPADEQVGGLEFPAEKTPDYLDFAYFSFIIGMTFQVSDVGISSRAIRRVALLHSLISFVFNTIVVALTVSILSSLGH